MPTASRVWKDPIDESTCFHTGVAFCPLAVSSSYSLRARASSSVKIGKLFEMAMKNICGPMVSDGSSRAICWIDMFNPL